MNNLGKAVLQFSEWDAYAEACARSIPHDSPLVHVDNIKKRVLAGEWQVWKCIYEGKVSGIIVYQIEDLGAGRELVMIAAYVNARVCTTLDFIEYAEGVGRALGCKQVRIHTSRPGIIKKADALGFRVSETILRKNI
jgi:hypothetical protein